METLTDLFIKSAYAGVAAVGFGILFNVPRRTILYIFSLGFLDMLLRIACANQGINLIFASFFGSAVISVLSLFAAHDKKSPPLVFSIPAVIPMVPGLFTYRMMIGIMRLTGDAGPKFLDDLTLTMNNGLKASFILMALAAGVSTPNILLRRDSFHNVIRFSQLRKPGRRKRTQK